IALSDSCERSDLISEARNSQSKKLQARREAGLGAEGASTLMANYQMAQRFAGAIGAPVLQPKAFWNSGRFTTTPFTRNSSGECGSVCTRRRRSSGRLFWHQPCP